MGYLEQALAALDSARRTGGRNIQDLFSDPAAYAEKIAGHLRNTNAGVTPVASPTELTNRPLTMEERVAQTTEALDPGHGLMLTTKWPKHVVDALKIKRLETPSFSSWDVEKKYPNTHEVTLRGNTLDLPESTVDSHVAALLRSKKVSAKPVIPPPPEILDAVNASGREAYGTSFIPYGEEGAKIHYEEIPIEKFMKKFPGVRSSKQNSYNYDIGIQGIAHGTDPTGKFLPLMKSSDVTPGSIISGYTNDAADQTIWKIK